MLGVAEGRDSPLDADSRRGVVSVRLKQSDSVAPSLLFSKLFRKNDSSFSGKKKIPTKRQLKCVIIAPYPLAALRSE